jgi:hypothetical protein
MTNPGLIMMWAAPRSRSTAFFRCMLEYGLVALHEPFCNIADHGTGFTQSASGYETTTADNAMLARFTAHHEPFYQALRAHRIAVR